jgi:hypothetical protein
MIRDGAVTPDGYAVNTIDPISTPHDPRIPDGMVKLPVGPGFKIRLCRTPHDLP